MGSEGRDVCFTVAEIVEHDRLIKIKTLAVLREKMMTNMPCHYTQWTMEVVEGMMKEMARA